MKRPTLTWFAVRVCAGLVLLLLAWSVLARPYGDAFRALGEAVTWVAGHGEVAFVERLPGDPEPADTVIVVPAHGAAPAWTLRCDSRFTGYLPTIVFVALLLATPLPWRRRRWAGLLGLVAVQGYVATRLALGLLVGLSRNAALAPEDALPGFLTRPGWLRSIQVASSIVDREPTFYVGLPVLVWIVLVFRASDRERWIATGPPEVPARETSRADRLHTVPSLATHRYTPAP